MIMLSRYFAVLITITLALSCRAQVAIEDISRAPDVTESDLPFAGVFKGLDGIWRGQFFVYKDSRGQVTGNVQPDSFDISTLRSLPLETDLVVDVRQTYRSESPYFQRVEIRDSYRNADGKLEVIESRGVNKIQNGEMWCVVTKPDETVIHAGSVDGSETIIWRRSISEPLKIERFRETVREDTYSIIGWGYYGDDNPGLSPRYWFEAHYQRIE